MSDMYRVGVGYTHTIFLYVEGNMSDIFTEGGGVEPYKDLASAIVIQAIKDYKYGRIGDSELKKFLFSEWYQMLTGVSGSYLYRRVTNDRKRAKRRD